MLWDCKDAASVLSACNCVGLQCSWANRFSQKCLMFSNGDCLECPISWKKKVQICLGWQYRWGTYHMYVRWGYTSFLIPHTHPGFLGCPTIKVFSMGREWWVLYSQTHLHSPTSPHHSCPFSTIQMVLLLCVLKLIFCLINLLIAWLLSAKMYIFPLITKDKAQQLMSGCTPKGLPLPMRMPQGLQRWVQGKWSSGHAIFFTFSS